MSAPDAPKGAGCLFEDSDGGLWIVGVESGEGLSYFDGTRFFWPLKDRYSKLQGTGIAEDSDKGIWIASTAGLLRYYHGQLQKIVDRPAYAGVTQVAPDVLLSVVGTDSHDSDDRPRLVRISKVDGRWKADTVIDPFPLVRLQPDKSGHILFACKGGYCELASDDIVRWKPVSSLKMMRYKAVTRDDYARDEGFVWRDRFECVWMRSWTGVSYQCPTDKQPVVLPPSIVGLGNPIILEMNDGSVVLPSLNKLAIGRPGHFRVVMLLTT